MYLVFAALVIQPCIVLAQSQSSNSYYYWLTPARIVGIAIGGLALILLFISLLVLVRRRFHRRSPSRVAPSSSFTSGAVPLGTAAQPPPAYPSWTAFPAVQQSIQTTTPFSGPRPGYGSGPVSAPSSGLYYPTYPTSPVPLYGHPKPIVPSSSSPARPSSQPGQALSTAPSLQGQGVAPPDRSTPSVQTHEQGQEQGAAPPPPSPRRHRPSYAMGSRSAGAGREESPPPYSPPGPQPPGALAAT